MAEPEWIETTEALAEFLAAAGEAPLALDTEADSFHHYHEKVCLVQLAAGGRCALVDPLADCDLRALAPRLDDPSVRKILHGSDYDVRLLHREFGIAVRNLFDTMIAARLAGEPALGLASLLEAQLGIAHDKSQQRADWSRRPLTAAMRAYAADDVLHLEELAGILDAKLLGLGRAEWVREECARLEEVRWRKRRDEDPEPFRRVKGAAALPPRALAVLREVWTCREEVARRRDQPPFRILRNEVLIDLAKTPPSTVADLGRTAGFPGSLLRSPAAHDLVLAAQRGAHCPDDLLPQTPAAVRPKIDPAVDAEAARLRDARDGVARDLALDPAIVASRALLDELARRIVAGEDPWAAPELRRWQAGLLRPRLP
jgi:ribonuclease D